MPEPADVFPIGSPGSRRFLALAAVTAIAVIASPELFAAPPEGKGPNKDDEDSGRSDKVEVCAWFEPIPGANILGVDSAGNVIDEFSDPMDPYCHNNKEGVHNVIGFRWGIDYNKKWPRHQGRQIFLFLPDVDATTTWIERKFDGGKASVSTEYYFDSSQNDDGSVSFANWCYPSEVHDIDMPAMPTVYDFAVRLKDCLGTPEHPNPTLTALTFDFYALEKDAAGNEIEVTYRIRNGASRGRGCWSDPETYGPCPDDPVVVTRVNQSRATFSPEVLSAQAGSILGRTPYGLAPGANTERS